MFLKDLTFLFKYKRDERGSITPPHKGARLQPNYLFVKKWGNSKKRMLHKIEEHDILKESMFDKMQTHMKISQKKHHTCVIEEYVKK